MKKILLLILTLIHFSCDKSQKKHAHQKLNMNEQNKLNCSNQEKKALADLKKNKITYYQYSYLRSEKELSEILSKYKIGFKTGEVGSCLSHVSNGEFCYAQIMKNEIIKRYGPRFLDSLIICAEKKFELKNPEAIFFSRECDEAKSYPNPKNEEDFWDKPSKEFNTKFVYPKDYVKNENEYYNNADAKFILCRNGKIDSLKIKSEFKNPKNNVFKSEIEIAIKKYIEQKKWIPLKRLDMNVNSEINLTFDLK